MLTFSFWRSLKERLLLKLKSLILNRAVINYQFCVWYQSSVYCTRMHGAILNYVQCKNTRAYFTLQKAMRTQDVKLMKQLIGINESIRNLTKSRQQRTSTGARVVSTSDFAAMATPLVRQQSAPSYNKLHRNDSMGSIESSEGRNQ